MAYLKPQSPLKNNDDYIYPLTTADQVIMEDGSRLNNSIISTDKIVNNFTTTEEGFVADARAVAVLHDATFPDYDSASYIDNGRFGESETNITRAITAEEDCFVSARVYTDSTAAQSSILVTTTGGYVISYAKMAESAKYVHLTTAVFPLRKGQTVTFTINSASGNSWGINKF